ncbi:hypothetical protein ABUW04_00205 [Streptacidiphilus sp. N1-10]|uniref:Uncharacterized protein n=1 Tax=Streptacidiphilus jeojiensis TaxID=3229225 RepID=A0ABV6XEI0_9ACTN
MTVEPVAALRPLTPARTVTGRVACLIGSDLHLETPRAWSCWTPGS